MKRRIKKIRGNQDRPRLSIYRSLRHLHAQVINDDKGITLVGITTLEKDIAKKISASGGKNAGNKEAAKLAGSILAQRAKAAGIEKVVFDRGEARYHGRIKDFADSARAGGLKF